MVFVKYIAAGFVTDAAKLLKDFREKDSLEFSAFAEVWRKNNFSLIYMFRQNEKELSEFTQEIFRLSQNFLTSSSSWKKVGGVYLLYALFRNQIIEPPIRIRITQAHFQNLIDLLAEADLNGMRSLHYVLDYLFENAFELVAFPKLMGPNVRQNFKKCDNTHFSESEFSWSLDDKLADELEGLHQLFAKYNALRKVAQRADVLSRCQQFIGGMNHLQREYLALVESHKYQAEQSMSVVESAVSISDSSNIGSRRFRLKCSQFSQGVSPYINPEHFSHETDSACLPVTEVTSTSCSTKRQKKSSRRPQHRREKIADAVDSDDIVPKFIEAMSSNSHEHRRYERGRRMRRYYNDGNFEEHSICYPKPVDVSSNTEDELSLSDDQSVLIEDVAIDEPSAEDWNIFDAGDLCF